MQTPEEKGDVDPYVEISLFDPANKNTRRQETSHLQNEPNPKWGEKFDFPMVSAPSILTGNPSNPGPDMALQQSYSTLCSIRGHPPLAPLDERPALGGERSF